MELELLELVGKELGVRIEVGDDPWVDLPKKLRRGEFDVLFCALIPSAEYTGIAYTRSYLDMGLVVMRRAGDQSIRGLPDLARKVVGHIADPAAEKSLAETGLMFEALKPVYDDDYYQPVVDGVYDAFAIDLPIVYWCATSPDSPWHGKIEVVGEPFTRWIYCAATRADDASASLLAEIDRIVERLRRVPEYSRIVRRWQGSLHDWRLGPQHFL
jgi:ABC-type amino acid transport substrate-binding protein